MERSGVVRADGVKVAIDRQAREAAATRAEEDQSDAGMTLWPYRPGDWHVVLQAARRLTGLG